jgi:hypothetical protein
MFVDIYLPKGCFLAIDLNPDSGACELDIFRLSDGEFVGQREAFHPESYSRFHTIAEAYCNEFLKAARDEH